MTTRASRRAPDARMPLREHLREFRNRLILAFAGIGIAAIAGWFLYPRVFAMLQEPVLEAAAEKGLVANINFAGLATALDIQLKMSIVIGIILWVQATSGVRSPLLTVALGLLFGGAIGNLIDRLRFGHVIDWVDTGLGSLRFYTFNVADAAISIAVVLLIAMSLLGPRLGRLVGAAPPPTEPVTDGGRP